ncbi:MAG: hypothetical protein KDB72_02880 [Mycobacterium sp.]|nr:hypothetical protein [Mycobacterium sp.]
MSRFILSALESGPRDLYAAIPLAGDTIGMRTTAQGETVYYAVLDEPLRDRTADPDQFTPARCGEDPSGRFVWVSDIVFRPTTPGAAPHFGMRGFPIELAYVLDPEMRRSDTIDDSALFFTAIGFIDDIDDTAAAPAVATVIGNRDLDFDELAEAPPPQTVTSSRQPPRRPLIDLPPLADELEGDQELVTVPTAAPPAAIEGRRPLIDLPPLADELEDDLNPVIAPGLNTPMPVPSVTNSDRLRPALDRSQPTPPPVAEPRPRRPLSGAADSHSPASSPAAAKSSAISEPRVSAPVEDLAAGPLSRRDPARLGLIAAIVLAAAGLIGLIAWSLNRDDSGETIAATSTSAPAQPSPSATETTPSPTFVAPSAPSEQVLRLLPVGYPEKACTPEVAVPFGALGAVTCGVNTDPGGPRSARYTLLADLPALQAQFTEITSTTRQQICPGNIQSPGPWRHNATPDQVAGQLYCGTRDDGTPIIAWTDDARLLLSVVDAAAGGEVAAFKWWSSHS